MDELRVTRREEDALILTNELGEEFRLVVDEVVQSEFRQLNRRQASTVTVRPREIQALLRAGKTRAEVAEETGLDESDVERFEEPVRAEQRYILELAHAVTVRTDPDHDTGDEGEDQRFGEVIAERLIGLGSVEHAWRSWRDETTGWLVGLEFMTRDVVHDAIWAFDHRKRVLSPLSPDATHLSKSGDVGDQLIPKLRAVGVEKDAGSGSESDRFDSDAFDPDTLLDVGEVDASSGDVEASPVSPATIESAGSLDAAQLNPDDEYERRREIDQLAVNKPDDSDDDLSQTADLLDALRRRRGERANQLDLAFDGDSDEPSLSDSVLGEHTTPVKRPSAATNIWGASGVSAEEPAKAPEDARLRAVDRASSETSSSEAANETNGEPTEQAPENEGSGEAAATSRSTKPSRRGRSSIPSWDDILFGTRSDDDPA